MSAASRGRWCRRRPARTGRNASITGCSNCAATARPRRLPVCCANISRRRRGRCDRRSARYCAMLASRADRDRNFRNEQALALRSGHRRVRVKTNDVEILVIGAGIVGIATAYYLAVQHKRSRLLIVDEGQPMALTSAQSGENYRNWWPHQTMAAFTDHSTDLMEDIARRTDNRFNMTRRGYLLVTREEKPEELLRQLYAGYGASASKLIRQHEGVSRNYSPALSEDWQTAPDGVDVLLGRDLIQQYYPAFDRGIATALHIRRAGDISGQQLGQYMLETMRPLGAQFQQARVVGIAKTDRFVVEIIADGERRSIKADIIVNAAGPFAAHIAAMHGEKLPILNVLQQKIAFVDRNRAVDRKMPFAIDLDGQTLGWSADECEALAADPELARLLEPMPGSIHCRPDGGDHGQWIKLGWAFNAEPSEPN